MFTSWVGSCCSGAEPSYCSDSAALDGGARTILTKRSDSEQADEEFTPERLGAQTGSALDAEMSGSMMILIVTELPVLQVAKLLRGVTIILNYLHPKHTVEGAGQISAICAVIPFGTISARRATPGDPRHLPDVFFRAAPPRTVGDAAATARFRDEGKFQRFIVTVLQMSGFALARSVPTRLPDLL